MSIRDNEQLQRMTNGIVGAQARHRRRTRWAVFAGFVLAVAVAIPVAVVVDRPTTSGRPAVGAARMPVAGDGAVYAVVLIDWRTSGVLTVHDRVCTSAGVCSAGRPTEQLRRDLSTLLGPRLRFTATAQNAIALRKLTVHGDHATVVLQDSCGRRCYSGERVTLIRTGTMWHITGNRERWIT